jgi:hypothetical protein
VYGEHLAKKIGLHDEISDFVAAHDCAIIAHPSSAPAQGSASTRGYKREMLEAGSKQRGPR